MKIYNLKEVVNLLGLNIQTIRQFIKEGRLKAVKSRYALYGNRWGNKRVFKSKWGKAKREQRGIKKSVLTHQYTNTPKL